MAQPIGYDKNAEFTRELTKLINKLSLENDSNTPDFVLADYLLDCLESYNRAVKRRTDWTGRG